MNFLSEEKRAKLSEVLFYVALTIELGIMLLDKSELYLRNFSTYVFYVTFAISLTVVLLMKHDKKEWIVLGVIFAFSFICWRITRRNDILRYTVFVMAARDVDVKKTMKYVFYVMSAGFALIALMAELKIYGNMALPLQDFGRGYEETRYTLGFGHPNDFYSCIFSIVLLWMWVYGETSTLREWIFVFLMNYEACILSQSRTGKYISLIAFFAGFLVKYAKKFRDSKIAYVLAAVVSPVLCVAFSVWAAIVSYIPRYELGHKYYNIISSIDDKLTGRIHALSHAYSKPAGAIETWKLFSDISSDEAFDMGWVKIFYQFGIIPGIVVVAIVILLIAICYKKKDVWTLIVIMSLSIYTVVEAIFVSRFMGRLFILPVVGAYLGEFVRKRIGDNV